MRETFESSLKCRWLTKGEFFNVSQANEVVIRVPRDFEIEVKSVIGSTGGKDAAGKMAERLGQGIKLILFLDGDVPETEAPLLDVPATE